MRDIASRRFDSNARNDVSTLIVVALFLLLTVTLALRLNIWQDEAYSLHTTSEGLANALRQGVFYEAQAPLYFGVLDVWRSLNGSPFFARLLSVAASLVTIGFTWRFAKRYLRAVPTGIVTAAVAFNPFTVWAAIEARPYACSIALATALLYYLFRGWIDDEPSAPARIVFVFVAVVAAYTQYYVATLVAAGFIVLLALRQRNKLRSYLGATVIVAIALAPLALIVPIQLKAYVVGPYSDSHFAIFSIVLAVLEFLFPHDSIGSWAHRPLLNAGYFLAVAVPVALTAAGVAKMSIATRAAAGIVGALCLLFALIIGPGHVQVIWPRQTAVLLSPTILAAFACIGDVRPSRRSIALRTFLGLYLSLTVLALWSQYHGFSKDGDWRRVGAFLTKHVSSSDAVTIFDAEAELPLRYYFHATPITPIPRPISFDRFDETDFIIRDEADVAASLGAAARGRPRLWLVLNDVCTTSPAFYGCAYLQSYLSRNFTIVSVTSFNRSSVLQLRSLTHR